MKNKIFIIESLRGLAAWYVFFGHIVLAFKPYTFFPALQFLIKTVFGYGHQAVLLFFILSGFSIHYSTMYKKIIKPSEDPLKDYFYKRFKRIYPIFLISIIFAIFCLFLMQEPIEVKKVICSLLFLTDLKPESISYPISTNFPIWSLSYEVFYYILYIPLYKFIIKLGTNKVFIYSILLSIVAYCISFYFKSHITYLIEMYWLWVGGAFIAHLYISNKIISNNYFVSIFMISVGLMLTLENVFVIRDWSWGVFFMLLLITGLPNVNTKTKNIIFQNIFLGLTSLFFIFYLTYFEELLFHPILLRILIPFIGLIGLSLILIDISKIINYIKIKLIFFKDSGAYSYGLYIIHWPIISLVIYYTKSYLNNFYFMVLIIIFTIIIVYFIARLLELKLQPKISKILDKIYYIK